MKLTTSHGIKSFQYYGARLWNSLPADIKSAVSISQFKILIRKWSGPDCKCSVCIMILWQSERYILRLFYPYYMVHAIFVFFCRPYNTLYLCPMLLSFVSWWKWSIVLFYFYAEGGELSWRWLCRHRWRRVVAFTTYGAAGDGRVGAVAVPWFLCLCL